jgi:hypothetical protein
MSAVYHKVADKAVITAADTYSIRADTGEPLKLADKFIPLPHLNMVLTGTGYHGFLLEWYRALQREAAPIDVEHLNEFTPGLLQETWLRFKRKTDLPESPPGSGGSKICHLGYSERKERFVGYYYDLKDDFAPTAVRPGQEYLMPKMEGVHDALLEGDYTPQEQVIAFFRRAKELDEQKPVEERVGIGGEIKFLKQTQQGHVCLTIHRFDDYEETKQTIMETNQEPDRRTLVV